MDFAELTKVIYSRIQKVEPHNAIKILGCLFLNAPSEEQMIQLAFGPDEDINSMINDSKATLSLLSSKLVVFHRSASNYGAQTSSSSYARSHLFSSPRTIGAPAPCLNTQLISDHHSPLHSLDLTGNQCSGSIIYDGSHAPSNQSQLMSFEEQLDPVNTMGADFPNNLYYQEDSMGGGWMPRNNLASMSLNEASSVACHYFRKGYCKHGTNCRYFHSHFNSEGYSLIDSSNLSEMKIEDHVSIPGSLEKLELDIMQLLKEQRGIPVSIASLPVMYFEKYGRSLQAEGYLTESQNHGKAGFSLTKLLARLKNSIRLIDRPHGQHSVILAEDAAKYMEYRNDILDSGATVASSHQIYLTFPAESSFTEEDVSNYFKQYGLVRDVRIPCQDKRMFGFVSFHYPETVKLILTKRNPHYIAGARVLVKPYKEKSRTVDRNYMEKCDPAMSPHYLETDPLFHAMQRESGRSRLIRRQQMEEQEKLAELEQRRLSELNLTFMPPSQFINFSSGLEEAIAPEDAHNFLMADRFNHTHINNSLTASGNKSRHSCNSNGDPESCQIDRPEGPFAFHPVGSSISAAF
ncbi:zinc finger CCCH domain-containing protein 18-like isoform X2 [Typha angustifolia]|uniref:zinc finger CCCH domain-containing protein 18-like isoform X2 n=1 Tax=Typha angustifolia TaxID=59011 RepID=UPI003C2B85AC